MDGESGLGEVAKLEIPSPQIDRITLKDLEPQIPKLGETTIVLQRNAKDDRDPNSKDFGALVPQSADEISQNTKRYFDQIFENLGQEAKNVDIVVVASDTMLDDPGKNLKSAHKRAVETAAKVIAGLEESAKAHDIADGQILNKTDAPIELTSKRLTDLKMLEDSPQFVDFLKKQSTTPDGIFHEDQFWSAYENDKYKDTRQEMKAEGPLEISDRVRDYLNVVANAARLYHQNHPNRRLIFWAVSHYDAISPYIKNHILKAPMDTYLPVEHGAGISINVGKDNIGKTQLAGKNLSIEFKP